MARSQLLRFFLSPADQARIDPASVDVEDLPFDASPSFGDDYPQSMRVRFTVTDPQNGAPQIWPLFPGKLTFEPDPQAAGSAPDPAVDGFTQSAYASWRTQGRLAVAADPETAKHIDAMQTSLDPRPTMAWYSPVRIPAAFLFVTLATKLEKALVKANPDRPPTDPDWAKFAAFYFLAGRYEPKLSAHASDPAQDDVAAGAMPTVVMDQAGDVELVVATAALRSPDEGGAFAVALESDPLTDPAHPRNGAVPARHVYRSLRAGLIGAAASSAVLDALLADWPAAPRYFPIRFTRIWRWKNAQGKPLDTASMHFPAQTVTVKNTAGSTLANQRLACHGVLFLPQEPPQPASQTVPPPSVTVEVSPMKFLDGSVPNAFREPGQQQPISYTLDPMSPAHVLLRTPLGEQMLIEPIERAEGCTYATLRRFVRALVDQRVTGGRLSALAKTDATAKGLMSQAGLAPAKLADNKPPLVKAHKDDDGEALINQATSDLLVVLSAFFPATVPAESIGGSTARTQSFNYATVAVHLWNTNIPRFQEEGTKRNYPDSHVGRGGPGGAVVLGLAEYHLNPGHAPAQPLQTLTRGANESDEDYHDRIVGEMLSGLEPGAVLQLWTNPPLPNNRNEYEDMRTRTKPNNTAMGHSTMFLEYVKDGGGNVDGFAYLDYLGRRRERRVKVTNGKRMLAPGPDDGGFDAPIWVAANWTD